MTPRQKRRALLREAKKLGLQIPKFDVYRIPGTEFFAVAELEVPLNIIWFGKSPGATLATVEAIKQIIQEAKIKF